MDKGARRQNAPDDARQQRDHGGETMRGIGIPVRDQAQGTFVLDALNAAAAAKRATFDDIAFVSKERDGKVKIHQTKDADGRKGAVRGGLVGALIGLAAPPFLAVTAVGAGIGALVAHLRDGGLDNDLMKSLGEDLEPGQGIVFALGDEASIALVAERVRDLTDGNVVPLVFSIGDDHDTALRAMAVDIPGVTGLEEPIVLNEEIDRT
jgi:uncharacterized membrane protein